MLVDSHCHLDFPDFAEDLDAIVERAGEAGVGMMLTICTHLTRFERVLAVAERYENIYCTVGIHPHEAESEPEALVDELLRMADHPKVVGFGETGLDFFYEHSPRDIQERQFRAHIEAARQSGLPVIIHTRDADADMARILDEEAAKGAFPGLIHCFSSGIELAEKAVENGLYISLSGILTFNKAENVRDAAKAISINRLLVETDAPYLSPVPKRGKRNEPAFTVHTAARLAEIKGMTPNQIAQATTANFLRLFSKIPAPAGI